MAKSKQASALLAAMQHDVEEPVVTPLDIAKVRQLVERLMGLQSRQTELALQLEAANRELRQVKEVDLPTLLDEVGVNSLVVDGHSVTVKTEYFPNVVKANEQKFFDWLRSTGHDDLIKNEIKVAFGRGDDQKAAKLYLQLAAKYETTQKLSVHASTLKAFVREQMEAGAPLPNVLDINAVRTTIVK